MQAILSDLDKQNLTAEQKQAKELKMLEQMKPELLKLEADLKKCKENFKQGRDDAADRAISLALTFVAVLLSPAEIALGVRMAISGAEGAGCAGFKAMAQGNDATAKQFCKDFLGDTVSALNISPSEVLTVLGIGKQASSAAAERIV
jgi:hypothetical protein